MTQPISTMTDGAPALAADRIEISRETSPSVWSTLRLSLSSVIALLTGNLKMGASVDVASAATTDIGAAAGQLLRITGTTTITALGTADAGEYAEVRFAAALTLTHHATSLILPNNGSNIVTAAGDTAMFVSLGSGNWVCTRYERANGTPLDSDLAAIAALTTTTFGRSLLTLADAAATRTTLNVAADPMDPTAPSVMVDDFFFSSTETGETGEGWSFANGTLGMGLAQANHPGIADRASSAVANAVAWTIPGGIGSVRFDQIDVLIWIAQPVTILADHDARYGYSSDWTSRTPASGLYFERLAADTNWFAVVRTASAETRVDTGVPYAAAWFNLRVRRISSTQVGFSINGGAETVISASIPSAATLLVFGQHIVPTTALAVTQRLDYCAQRLLSQTR